MPVIRTGMIAILVAVCIPSLPSLAQEATRGPLAGWWGYDKSCPASDDGFGLARDGRASDGSGAYSGRWSLQRDQVTIVWEATEAERPHIDPGKWRIVENYRLAREPRQSATLTNVKTGENAWLCRQYR